MRAERGGPGTAWRALTGSPLRLLSSSWPWRSVLYLVSGFPVAAAWLLFAVAALGVGLATAPFGIGLVLLASIPFSGVALGTVERWRLRLVDLTPAPSPHHQPDAPGFRALVLCRLREAATWRELACAPFLYLLGLLDAILALLLLGLALGLLTAPVQAALLPVLHPNAAWQQVLRSGGGLILASVSGLWAAAGSAYLLTAWAALRAALTRRLLVAAPKDDPARIVELTQSRARIVDAFEADRRRIERDLHDGVQQRLTGLIMTLGLARLELAGGPPAALDLTAKAQEEARQTLEELRDLVRGIHPSVLTDRGLPAAVATAAERCPVPVDLDLDLPGRLPEAVESTVYFVVCEALANVAKHSKASRATVVVRRVRGSLALEVHDDGVGGADAARGGGLVGLADRVATLDGTVRLSSPPGGPSVLRVEIPCGL